MDQRVVAVSSFAVVLFCGLLDFILYENLMSRGIFFLYFFGFTVLPLILYAIDRHSGFFTKNEGLTASGWVALAFNALFCLKMAFSPDVLSLSFGIGALMMAYAFLMILRPALFKDNVTDIALTETKRVISSAVVATIALLGFLNTFVAHLWFDVFDGIAAEIPQWGGWPAALVGAFAVLSGYVLWGRGLDKARFGCWWTRIICLSPILLFSIQSSFDIDHYDAFIAPAIAVLHGQIPLVDVFCQYGLGYLLFTLAFLVLPNTYAVCAAIVSIINIGGFVLYLLILRTLIKNPYHFALMGLTSVWGIYCSNATSMNLLPSSFGFRYLPALLFVYFLIRGEQDENKLNTRASVGFLLLNALWSIECLVFYFFIAGFYCWLQSRSVKPVLRAAARLVFQLTLAVLFLFILYCICFQKFPNYKIYLEYPLSYLSGRHDAGSFTQNIGPFTGRYLFFFPMAVVLLVLFYWSVFVPKKDDANPVLNKLYVVNFSGIVFFVYIAVHSFVFHIKTEWALFLPGFIGAIFLVKEYSRNAFFRFVGTAVAWMMCLTFFCVFLVRTIYVSPSNSGINDTLVYQLVYFNKAVFKNFWYNINHFCNKMNYEKEDSGRQFWQPFQYTCRRYDFHQEVSQVIEKYYPDRKDILIFSVSAVEILFEHHKYHPLFINPMNDVSVDATQRDIVIQKLSRVKKGDIVVVDKDIGLDIFQADVLRLLWEKFGFDQIEEMPHLWVFKLNDKPSGGSPWFIGQKNIISYLGRNGRIDYRQPLSASNVDRRSYAYRDQVMSIELDFKAPFVLTGVKFWHLSGTRDILQNRLFSNDAINNFNILVSEDGKNWEMVVSKSGYFMNDKKYYYQDITPKKAKYVRLNFIVDNENILIPDIEIFGEKREK